MKRGRGRELGINRLKNHGHFRLGEGKKVGASKAAGGTYEGPRALRLRCAGEQVS